MANEFTVTYIAGRSVYLQVRRSGQYWDGTALEDYQDAHWGLYAITAAAVGASGDYVASMPPAAPPGPYDVVAFDRAGSVPATSDVEVAFLSGYDWRSAIVPAVPSTPSGVSVLFCTDEDLAIRAGDDYVPLCPGSNVLAAGIDGVISAITPWTLASSSADFAGNGVVPHSIVQLKGGTPTVGSKQVIQGSGQLFAVDSVAGGSITIRRPGLAAGVGQPPGQGGGTSFNFAVPTYAPQIESASYDLYQRYNLDPLIAGRSPSQLYDLRELQQLCVLEVLHRRLASAMRTSGDWEAKLKEVASELGDQRDRVQLKWGVLGQQAPPENRFSMRVMR